MMDILDKAKELGKMIADSKELSDYRRAEEALASDEVAEKLLMEFTAINQELMQAARDKQDDEKIVALKSKVTDKKAEIEGNETANQYVETREKYQSTLQQVNQILSFYINGGESCAPSKCGSCGGGCK